MSEMNAINNLQANLETLRNENAMMQERLKQETCRSHELMMQLEVIRHENEQLLKETELSRSRAAELEERLESAKRGGRQETAAPDEPCRVELEERLEALKQEEKMQHKVLMECHCQMDMLKKQVAETEHRLMMEQETHQRLLAELHALRTNA